MGLKPWTSPIPESSRKRRRFQFSLATLFVVLTLAGCCSGVGLLGRWIWRGETTIASFRCPQGQVIEVYQPHFMEGSQPIGVRVFQDETPVGHGFETVSFDMRVRADKLRLVSSPGGEVVGIFSLFDRGGVVSAWNPMFVYQFSTDTEYHGEEAPDDLLRPLFADFHERYPGDRTGLMGRYWND